MTGQSLVRSYLGWVAAQELRGATTEAVGNKVNFVSPDAIGSVEVYELEMDVVAMMVTDPSGEDRKFFLHFELDDLERARELFASFREGMESAAGERNLHVLLSCTSSLTTSYFADKLNEAVAVVGYRMEFAAVPFARIYEEGGAHDAILLAPQVSYHERELARAFPNKFVGAIPPTLFANYDVGALIDFLREEQHAWREERERRKALEARAQVRNDARVLVLAVLPDRKKIRIFTRVYQGGKVKHEETSIIVRHGGMEAYLELTPALKDIVATLPSRHMGFDVVGVALPGVIDDGRWVIDGGDGRIEVQLQAKLERKAGVPVVVTNNVNAAAIGYTQQEEGDGSNLVFMSQPLGGPVGGLGIVIGGRVIHGAHGGAGELKYLVWGTERFRQSPASSYYDPEFMYDDIAISLRASIAVVDPGTICVRNPLTHDMGKLRGRLAAYIPEQDLPELRHVSEDEMLEYVMLGQMHLCLDRLER